MLFKFSRKSQSALEFLVTYGWAFLVTLLVVGSLSYFGVIKISNLLPEYCNSGNQIKCDDYKLDFDSNSINLSLNNNLGINISLIDSYIETINNKIICSFNSELFKEEYNEFWNFSKTLNFNYIDCNYFENGFSKNNKDRLYFVIKYKLVYHNIPLENGVITARGEIFAQIS